MLWNYQGHGFSQATQLAYQQILLENILIIPKLPSIEDKQIWQLVNDKLYFYHYIQGQYVLIFIFQATPSAKYTQYQLIKPYLCSLDTYSANLEYSDSSIIITTTIVGAVKNEMIKYNYSS